MQCGRIFEVLRLGLGVCGGSGGTEQRTDEATLSKEELWDLPLNLSGDCSAVHCLSTALKKGASYL